LRFRQFLGELQRDLDFIPHVLLRLSRTVPVQPR
jgi:hypothetical protein